MDDKSTGNGATDYCYIFCNDLLMLLGLCLQQGYGVMLTIALATKSVLCSTVASCGWINITHGFVNIKHTKETFSHVQAEHSIFAANLWQPCRVFKARDIQIWRT
ncbi:UNVERIFIED_CONTAM: hypothetical protein K2H54_044401 [Gekko kuhli]